MTTSLRRRSVRIAAMSCLAALALRATGLDFTWTGLGSDGNPLNSVNWVEGMLIPSSSTNLVFGAPSATDQTVFIPGSLGPVEFNDLTFLPTSVPARPAYTFEGVDSPTLVVYGNLDVGQGGDVTFASSLNLTLSAGAHTITVADSATTVSVQSAVSESGGMASLVKTGDGRLVLGGSAGYSGGTSIQAGTLEIATAGALGAGTDVDVQSGGTFAVSADQTIRALTGDGTVDLAADRTLTINLPSDGDGSSATFDGSIEGDGSLVKDGPGYLTLTGNSAYAGGTSIATGTLEVAGGSISHAAADLSVGDQNDGTLAITGGGSVSVLNATIGRTGSGYVTVSGSGPEVPSRLEVHGDLNVGGDAESPAYGFGSLSITEGGRVTTSGTSYFGVGPQGSAYASVSGAGSSFNTADVVVGAGGSASLWIQDGGLLDVTCDTWIGRDEGSSGSILLSGAGSQLNTTKLVAGVAGSGSLHVTNGATVTIGGGDGTLVLGQNAGSSGNLFMGDGNTADPGVLNAAAVTAGDGAGQITFFTQSTAASPDYFTRDGTASGASIAIDGNINVWSWSGAHVLSGDNSYTGSTFVVGGTMIGTSNTAFGSGHLYLSNDGTVELDSAQPTLGGLSSLTVSVDTIGGDVAGGAVPVTSHLILSSAVEQLTVSPASSDFSNDTFNGVISGVDGALSSAMLIKSGDGQLDLGGANLYSGGTLVESGLLVASNTSSMLDGNNAITSGPLGTGDVTVNAGAALGLGHNTTIFNPVTLTGSSEAYAAIGGFGTLAPTDGTLVIGDHAAISPGAKLDPTRHRDGDAGPVGTFSIGTVTLPTSVKFETAGAYDWGVQDITTADGTGSDLIAITGTLTFNLDVSEVFAFRISSFDASGEAGYLADFDPAQAHEWVVLTATGGITGFDPTKIKFDAQGFLNSPNDFMFSLEQRAFGANGSELVLTFNPAAVPEPSTWALLLTGLALVGGLSLRRRRV